MPAKKEENDRIVWGGGCSCGERDGEPGEVARSHIFTGIRGTVKGVAISGNTRGSWPGRMIIIRETIYVRLKKVRRDIGLVGDGNRKRGQVSGSEQERDRFSQNFDLTTLREEPKQRVRDADVIARSLPNT